MPLPSADRVILVNTPTHDYASFGHFSAVHTPPLGLVSLATSLRLAGVDVEVLDAEYWQMELEEAVACVTDDAAQVVGLNTFSVNISLAQTWASRLAALGKTVVLGGPHVNLIGTSSLQRDFPSIEWAIRGDAELSLAHFVRGDLSSVQGLVNLRTGVEQPPEYGASVHQPVLDRSFSTGEPTIRFGKKWFAITTTRGCTFRCGFCAGCSLTSGQPYRVVSEETVSAELASLSALKPDGIRLLDDLPFRSIRAAHGFLEKAQEILPGVGWSVNLPLAYLRTMSGGVWRELAGLGLREVSFGVESGDMGRRRTLGKNASQAEIRTTAENALIAGVSAKVYFIIGTPGETSQQTRSTIALARELTRRCINGPEVRCSIFAFKPMPGSAYWSTLLNAGFTESELLSYSDFHLRAKHHEKHSWRSSLSFGEIQTDEIEQLIDDFYQECDSQLPDF